MSESHRLPQGVRLRNENGRLYFCFEEGGKSRRKDLGPIPSDWPKDMIPAGKKRYGLRRLDSRPENEYHRVGWARSKGIEGEHSCWLATVYYPGGGTFTRVYTDHQKAVAFVERQKKSPLVRSADVTQIR